MRILCDVDGVLADFVYHACTTINKKMPHIVPYLPAHFTSWQLEETLSPYAAEVLREATCKKGWCDTIPPYKQSTDFFHELKKEGDVRVLTAAVGDSDHWIVERKAWLKFWFSVDQEDIVFCPGKEKRFHFGDLLIEDRLDTCKDFANQWGHFGSKALLIDRPWNQGATPFGVYRCSSYAEILELIKS